MGNANSGRRPKRNHKQNTELKLAETGPQAAAYLEKVINNELQGDNKRIDSAKYVISQVVGSPAQKTHSIEAITITIKQAKPPEVANV